MNPLVSYFQKNHLTSQSFALLFMSMRAKTQHIKARLAFRTAPIKAVCGFHSYGSAVRVEMPAEPLFFKKHSHTKLRLCQIIRAIHSFEHLLYFIYAHSWSSSSSQETSLQKKNFGDCRQPLHKTSGYCGFN